mmetsp:Transcript_22583/g.50629  ORF Transcript_22583/g.50629 Transcript_22583/m.50629 type:complete len:246 (-) Transcript_22583:2433-3170(-)
MWGAIRSDLINFVTTVTDDTTKTLNKVLGEEDEEEVDVTLQEKLVADLKRSFETYATPIREADLRDYDRFRKKASLSSLAAEIAAVLDQEPEVSRFYAELVPSMTPDEFWSKLFFRIRQVYRNGGANLEDDEEEEELVWETEAEEKSGEKSETEKGGAPAGASAASVASTGSAQGTQTQGQTQAQTQTPTQMETQTQTQVQTQTQAPTQAQTAVGSQRTPCTHRRGPGPPSGAVLAPAASPLSRH